MAQKKINKIFKKVLTKTWEAPTMGTLSSTAVKKYRIWVVSSVGRAAHLHCVGRRFEPVTTHQI
jgi:hypothetical protein